MKAQRNKQPFETYKIHCNDSEYLRVEKNDIYGETEIHTLPWDKVNLVWVYKLDCFATDRICMLIVINETDTFTIHEDMKGWDELLKILPDRLQGINNDWWSDVAFPAFETNLSLIYKNPNADQTELDKIIEDYEANSKPQVRHMTIFHLFAYIIFFIAIVQGWKAGILGILISLVVGTGAALVFFYTGFILYKRLPKHLVIVDLIRYKKESEEALSSNEKVLDTIYFTIILFAHLIWFILCSLSSFYLMKYLLILCNLYNG